MDHAEGQQGRRLGRRLDVLNASGRALAGLGEAAFQEFAVWAFLGGAVRAEILGLSGWRMRAYGDPAALLGTGTLVTGAALAAISVIWVVWSRLREDRASRK